VTPDPLGYNRLMVAEPDLEGLISAIYDAVSDAARWPLFLEAFRRATRAKTAAFFIQDPLREEFSMSCQIGVSLEDQRLYFEKYAADDPWNIASENAPEGAVAPSQSLVPVEVMERSAVYREYYAPRGLHCGMGGCVLKSDTGRSIITIVRGMEEGLCGDEELSLLRALLPHLRRAAVLHGQFARMRSELAALTQHLDRLPHGFALTDGKGKVFYSNAAAKEILSNEDGLSLDLGAIRASRPEDHAALRRMLSDCAEDPNSPARRIAIARPSGSISYWLLLVPSPRPATIRLGADGPSVAVLLMNPDYMPEPDPSMLRELFSLTPAEARLAAALVEGQNLEEAAVSLAITIETARTHLRRIFSKTSTNRQGELISLIMRVAPLGRGLPGQTR
jgi:DNA-binding CsgD family transcriptional regulator